MSEGDTLAKALADVRQRMTDLQTEYDRVSAELTKLRIAEKSLASIVEGGPLEAVASGRGAVAPAFPGEARSVRGGGRGSRGPRANSAKGRLKALLEEAGPQGLSHAEIARRLPDVAPNTLNTYLSVMANSGEAVRRGDFYAAGTPRPASDETPEDEADGHEPEDGDEKSDVAG
ncbi:MULTISPECIES: hypothetical protein [Methylorubrum]|uniref:hypothetical protein n=1 Tax=Methylorubrum TaxID=2282523 RepID=UPI00209CE864|nr:MULTISPECIES: hypothetical protein [Methylorubrum]MCP1550464.1 hypothetical protein [Methylorubrum zatmanii]MCP1552923.1 hypothetical protein [Methylorubrum extorquens]MCP1580767.1 hypothetical protein [Methylorubrum extorquens]